MTSLSSGYKTSSKKFLFLVMFYLTKSDNFWVIPKICKFMQANSWHHKLFLFHLSFWIWKVWKGREKLQKIQYIFYIFFFVTKTKKNFMAPFNGSGSTASRLEPLRGGSLYLYTVPTLLSSMAYVRLTNRSMLILDVFSASSSFGLETNRTASSDIDLNLKL